MTRQLRQGRWAHRVKPVIAKSRQSQHGNWRGFAFDALAAATGHWSPPDILALCPVCWWEDDGQEDVDAADVRNTVNGELSLAEARVHFSECGASHPRFLPYVRKPEVSEQ